MLNKGYRQRSNKILEKVLPRDRRFCKWCNQSFPLRFEMDHYHSPQHRNAVNGYNGMRSLANDLWVQHRGAPREEDISPEKEREILRHMPRSSTESQQQQQRSRILKGPTTRMMTMVSVAKKKQQQRRLDSPERKSSQKR